MGHCINAFLGYNERINYIAKNWLDRRTVQLQQGLSMLFLTDDFFDDITELVNLKYCQTYDGFIYLTSAIMEFLEVNSYDGKLAYFETNYFGGNGTQSAILYENGKQKSSAIFSNEIVTWTSSEERAINVILKEFGVYRQGNKDEFDSVGLNYFRKM